MFPANYLAHITQLVRVLVLWAKSRRFEPGCEHLNFLRICSHGLAVMTIDFESINTGSNPVGNFLDFLTHS